MERLQKVIAQAGVCSRRKAEDLIVAGRVKVDGVKVVELGTKVKGDQRIEVDGMLLNKENKVYYILNKPRNVLCTVSDDRDRETVIDLINDERRIFPVGRLDFDTTGLILLTNDGDFSNELTHPKYHIPKYYDVTVNGLVSNDDIKKMEKGVELDDGVTLPAKVRLIVVNPDKGFSVLSIRITEGRNRQIKRMMEALGFEVNRLHRKKLGNLELTGLNQGEYRQLKPFEIKALRAMANERTILTK